MVESMVAWKVDLMVGNLVVYLVVKMVDMKVV